MNRIGTMILLESLYLSICGVLCAYQLPEVYMDSVTASQVNRQADYITNALNQLDTRLDGDSTDIVSLSTQISGTNARVDTLAAHRDTLHNRCDTLANGVATLHLRVDSLMTRDSVFMGYNTSDISIDATSSRWLIINTENREDAIYTHAANDSIIDVSTAGDYLVSYDASIAWVTGSADGSVYMYLAKYTDDWYVVPGTYVYGSISDDDAGKRESLSGTYLITLAAGNDLSLVVVNSIINTNVKILSGTGRITIRKVQ